MEEMSASSVFSKARSAEDAGNLRQALTLYIQIIELFPDTFEAADARRDLRRLATTLPELATELSEANQSNSQSPRASSERANVTGLSKCPACRKAIFVEALSCSSCGHPLDDTWRNSAKQEILYQRSNRYAARIIIFAVIIGASLVFSSVQDLPKTLLSSLVNSVNFLKLHPPRQDLVRPRMSPQERPRMLRSEIQDVGEIPAGQSLELKGVLVKKFDGKKKCEFLSFKDWTDYCSFIATRKSIKIPPNTEATVLLVQYDGRVMKLSALTKLSYHQKFYTTKPPTIVVIGKQPYVRDDWFFNERFQPEIIVGDIRANLSQYITAAHWVASRVQSDELVRAFRAGAIAKIEYAHMGLGKGQTVEASLNGFSAALEHAKYQQTYDTGVSPSKFANSANVQVFKSEYQSEWPFPQFDAGQLSCERRNFGQIRRPLVTIKLGSTIYGLNGAAHGIGNFPDARSLMRRDSATGMYYLGATSELISAGLKLCNS